MDAASQYWQAWGLIYRASGRADIDLDGIEYARYKE